MKSINFSQSILDASNNVDNSINFRRDHIFYTIINKITNKSQDDFRLEFVYFFSLINKVLTSSVNERFELANTYCNEMKELMDKKDNKDKFNEFNILYAPCYAFLLYKEKNYDEAVKLLNSSLDSIRNTFVDKDDQEIKYLSAIEQQINIFRLNMDAKRYQEANKCLSDIIQFCNNLGNYDFKIDISDENEIQNFDDHLKYVFDATVKKIIIIERNEQNHFLKSLSTFKNRNNINSLIIKSLSTENREEIFRNLEKVLRNQYVSIPLLILLFKHILRLQRKNEPKLPSSISTFLSNKNYNENFVNSFILN